MNKRKVPKIRFKGFYDDWEQRKLGDIASDMVVGGDIDKDLILAEGQYPVIANALTGDGIVGYYDKEYRVNAPAVTVTGRGDVGHAKSRLVNFTPVVRLLSVKSEHDVFFLENAINTLKIVIESTGVPQLTVPQLAKYEVAFPRQLDEEEHIGAFFKHLDNLITLHQRKLEKLKIIKKSMLENCFPKNGEKAPKIRFSGFSDDWEQRKFGEVFMSLQNNTLSRAELNDEFGIAQNIHYGDVLIKYDDVLDVSKEPLSYIEKQSIADKFKTSYLQNGDVIIADTAEDETVGKCTEIEGLTDQKVISGLHTMPVRPNRKFAAGFLGFYLNSAAYHDQLKPLMQGIKVTSISKGAMQDTVVKFPLDLKEQEQIGMYFSGLDHLITLHQRKLELLERLRNSLANRCFIGEKCTMSKLILYHGSPNRVIVPKFGFGEDRHDYGRGFYLTENLELAKEWAVCRPDETNGWVHKYELEMEGLNILDFQKYDVLSWLAELMKHRDAADSRRYKMLAQKFIEKYGIDTCGYDVITGWRANASYFYIAKEFVRDNIDIEILEELLSLGGLGIQFCIKSERAFAQLSEVEQDIMSVDYSEFNDRYNSGTTICRAARS